MKAAMYFRVSTKAQALRESIETQKVEMIPWAENEGYEVAEFQDDGISAETISKRPGFSELLERLEAGEFPVLIVFAVDRIGRFKRRRDRYRLIQLFEDKKVQTVSMHDAGGEDERRVFLPTREDHMDDLDHLLREARGDNIQRSRKVKAGQRRVKALGHFAGGQPPYGTRWNKIDKKWEIDEDEHQTLKKAIELLCGGFGLQKTADVLNEDLKKYPTRTASKWLGTVLHRMVRNDFLFTGVLQYSTGQEELIPIDTGIRLFSKERVMMARHMMSMRRTKKLHDREHIDYLLQRLAVCGRCGLRLSVQTVKTRNQKQTYGYYYCSTSTRKSCETRRIRSKELDLRVWQGFVETLTDPVKLHEAVLKESFLGSAASRKDLETVSHAAEEKYYDIEKKKLRNQDLFIQGDIDKKRYEEIKTELETESEKVKEEWRSAQQALVRPARVQKAVEAATRAVSHLMEQALTLGNTNLR
ncbi:recombinase family protein, partial [Thermodesulfobacteriota bacterium]